ncbi:MAG: Short-chain dehydrogenase/reductase SDR, partial [uncultured Chloroflexia bacterium]
APLESGEGPLRRVAADVRRECPGAALRHRRRHQGDEGAGGRAHSQRLERRRTQDAPDGRRLLRDEVRRQRHLRSPAPGGPGGRHPRDDSRARRGGHGADRPHHRRGGARGAEGAEHGAAAARGHRQRRSLRRRPAAAGERQRDPDPPDAADQL